jgi:hypothetical protein
MTPLDSRGKSLKPPPILHGNKTLPRRGKFSLLHRSPCKREKNENALHASVSTAEEAEDNPKISHVSSIC